MSKNVYEEITRRFVEMLEKGEIPWFKMWSHRMSYNNTSNKDYNLLNNMLLRRGGAYDTKTGWEKNKGKIKEGEKPEEVVESWKYVTTDEGNIVKDTKLRDKVLRKAMWKIGRKVEIDGDIYWTNFGLRFVEVYHYTQVDGAIPKRDELNGENKDGNAEEVIKNYTTREGIKVHEGSNQAFYDIVADSITIPSISQYGGLVSHYYSTTFHELVHSTGAVKRLNRKYGKKFGDKNYATEELIAELGSAFILNALGLETDGTTYNSAGYLQNWIKALKEDSKIIYYACAGAEKASKYILA